MKKGLLKEKTLIAIGEALIDMIPDKSGCEFREVTSLSPRLGGAPANVCAAFAKLGGRARMLTQLGDDLFGHKIADEMSALGIDTSCIRFTDWANTALAIVSLGTDGSRSFSFYRKPSADMLYEAECVKDEYFNDAYALHFCSVSLGDFPMRDAHKKAITAAQGAGSIISFDPNLRFALWDDLKGLKEAVWKFMPCADIVKLSDEEIEFITGETDINKALPMLFGAGTKLVLYTCGSRGAYAYTPAVSVHTDGIHVNAVDTTGAGDGFIGAFLWKLAQSGAEKADIPRLDKVTLWEAIEFANRFCAISVQKKGAVDSYPDIAALAK